MKPYYEQDGITIYHGDCRDVGAIEYGAVISDPPYESNTDSTRFSGGQREHQHKPGRNDWRVQGYDEPFDPRPWVVEWTVLWGYQHFAPLLPTGTVLVWLKRPLHLLGTFLSDCEVAWKKGGCGVYVHAQEFSPPDRQREVSGCAGRAAHPNQKPRNLMTWSIYRSGCPEDVVILDPFMGIGTTLAAAKSLKRRAIGIEIEERYCEIAANRLHQGELDLGAA